MPDELAARLRKYRIETRDTKTAATIAALDAWLTSKGY
jgi:hypothetical protein